jgi:formate/nitrite transporter FocA (FNT family)
MVIILVNNQLSTTSTIGYITFGASLKPISSFKITKIAVNAAER